MTRLLCGLATGATLCLPLATRAAEIAIIDPALKETAELLSGSCSLRLQGPITAGDAAQLEEMLAQGALDRGVPTDLGSGTLARGHVLCLDSPGGDESAALALARVIIGSGIVTAVPDGARCIGACAVGFMAGSVLSSNSDGGARMPMRVLHTGGRLGFHAPLVADSDTAIEYFAGLTAAFTGIDSYVPTARFHPRLMIGMLAHRDPASPYMIDTTGQAGLYDIRLAGVPPVETNEAAWMRACNNLSLQAKDWQNPEDPDLSSWAWQVRQPEAGYMPEARLPPDDLLLPYETEPGGMPAFFREVLSRHHQCLIWHHPDASPPYAAWFERVSEDSLPQLRHFDLWQTLPHYTPLAALRGMERVEPADFASLYGAPPTDAPHPDLPPVTAIHPGIHPGANHGPGISPGISPGIDPGQSLVVRSRGESRASLAIWFGPDGAARLYPAGEVAIAARYRLQGPDLCLVIEEDEDQAERCGTIRSGDMTEAPAQLRLEGESFDIVFLRPGDIGPLPAEE